LEINSFNQSPTPLLLLLLRIKTPIRQGEICILKDHTITAENYTMIESIFWAINSCQICFTPLWARINLIRSQTFNEQLHYIQRTRGYNNCATI
jgi:hypothetical protein